MLWIAQLPGAVLCSSPTPPCVMRKSGWSGSKFRACPDERQSCSPSCSKLDPQLASMRRSRGNRFCPELSMQFQIGREAVVAACQRAGGMSLPLPQALATIVPDEGQTPSG